MIAKLTGLLDSTGPDWLIIDVGGVGYQVFASGRTLSQLPPMGQRFSLMIETLVRNEQTQLFGFSEERERSWFRLLLGIQGVGAKVALALLTALSADDLHRALLTQDQTLITRADGVGPKLAGRIVAELKGKVGGLDLGLSSASPEVVAGIPSLSGGMSEAISALTNLGYRRSEAVEAVAKSSQRLGPGASTEALIRQGLNLLSQSLASGASHG
ncbi:MAG: Holliday junction branch migration protein RuvA [Alphaproteobacteria bacterium]|jgi:Holliday junction DNA helicase RuvA|nr:Holliday junction branch migration protein RuvA [Alphaproteobacteria bacterium]